MAWPGSAVARHLSQLGDDRTDAIPAEVSELVLFDHPDALGIAERNLAVHFPKLKEQGSLKLVPAFDVAAALARHDSSFELANAVQGENFVGEMGGARRDAFH